MKTDIIISFLIGAAVAVSCGKSVPTSGILEVTGGKVQGVVADELVVFKGIPFAAPPVGELRWKGPQPVNPWDTVLVADSFSPGPYANMPFGQQSEDCLYLNVWTPAVTGGERLPVMVWLYGGGFSMGNAAFYDGAPVARKGVVFVAPNYRVGRLGFMAHPELDAENPEGVSGNYGILDQIAALKWVQDNIAAFGGDPRKVTVFGESAGAISVSMLCASPLAKGLFCGAISQSGGSFGPIRKKSYPGENMKTLRMAEEDALAYQTSVGASSLADLRAMDAKALSAQSEVTGGAWPVVDGYVIPDDQYRMYEAENFNDVALLIGYNSDEGDSFEFYTDPKDHIANVRKRYGPFADTLMKAYPMSEESVPKTGRDLGRDAAFGWHTWVWGRLQNEHGHSPVFMYYFDQDPGYKEGDVRYGHGSPHGQDVNFVFNSFRGEVSEADAALCGYMMRYWTNFAKYGDPNGEAEDASLPHWPRFENEDSRIMVLKSDAPHPVDMVDEASLRVLDSYFSWRRSPEGAAWAERQ